ncbi:MAG: hypothetical protein RL063_1248 [Pseudomonadota bacterium]
MLKKQLSNLSLILLMLGLGFGIFYYFLKPADVQSVLNESADKISTQSFFAAKLPNENGINQSLSQYKGKIIVLNFWATWCPPCREEMPELSQLQQQYQDRNVVVLGIAVDEIGLVKEFTQTSPVSYPLVADENTGMGLAINLGNDKGVLPYTVIIDANGKVIKTFFGRINKPLLERALAPLLMHL